MWRRSIPIFMFTALVLMSAPVGSYQVSDSAGAEMPMLMPVPFVFSKPDYAGWVAERGALYRRLSFLQRKGIDIIRDCRSAESGDQPAAECAVRRKGLSDERLAHIGASNAFNQRLRVASQAWLAEAEARTGPGLPFVVQKSQGAVILTDDEVEVGEDGSISASHITTGSGGQISILLANGYLMEVGSDSALELKLTSVDGRPKQQRLRLRSFSGALVVRPEDDWLSSTSEIAIIGPFGCICTKGGSLRLSTGPNGELTLEVQSGRAEILRRGDGQVIRLKSPGVHKFSP